MLSKKPVVRYFISFYDKEKFAKFPISGNEDIVKQIQFSTSYPIADIDKVLTQENPTTILRKPNSQKNKDSKQGSNTPQGKSQPQPQFSQGGRASINPKKDDKTNKQTGKPAGRQILDNPDDPNGSSKRVELAKEILTKKLDRIDEFTVNNCGFDWLQFGKLYSVVVSQPNNYLHTPISIFNVFKRDNPKENILGHMCRFQAIKFKTGEDDTKNNSNSGETPFQDLYKNFPGLIKF